jgi:hypothetical protein
MALPEYRLSPTNRNAREVARQMVPQMDMNPPYQRDHVWTVGQRRELVRSWIMGVPVGIVIINLRDNPGWKKTTGDVYEREDAIVYGCVDGKQRIETARWWFENQLTVPADWFDPEHVEQTIDFGGAQTGQKWVKYSWLTLPMQRHQGHGFQLPMVEAQLPSPESEAELFLLVNGGGTAQEPGVMERARKLAGR